MCCTCDSQAYVDQMQNCLLVMVLNSSSSLEHVIHIYEGGDEQLMLIESKTTRVCVEILLTQWACCYFIPVCVCVTVFGTGLNGWFHREILQDPKSSA